MKTPKTKIGFRDMTGMKCGKWKVIQYAGSSRWICKCEECGAKKNVIAWNLWSGHTSRCDGCRFKEQKKHGHAIVGRVTSTYSSWNAMRRRCLDPKNKYFKDYGGRGITVCKRWSSYTAFLEDMGEKPKGKVLDRKDNDGNYTPGNCRWVTVKVNASNKRNSRLVIYDGQRITLTAVEQLTGRCRGSLFQILKRFKWPEIDLKILPNPIPRNFLKKFQST